MIHVSSHWIFVFGFLAGTFISFILQASKNQLVGNIDTSRNNYERWFNTKKLTRRYVPIDRLRYDNKSYEIEAEFLFRTISVYCLIVTSKDNLNNLNAIKNTWGKECNVVNHINLNRKRAIFPQKSIKNDNSWSQLCSLIKSIPDNIKWVFITNEDTFAVMENLRYYLASKDSSKYFYLGYPVKFWNTVYNTGKAGYVISKGVVDKLQSSSCSATLNFRNKEDFMLGSHLKTLNISVVDTKDEKGFSLFHPYNLNQLLFPRNKKYNIESIFGSNCCSRHTITFNAIEADKMYMYHYMIHSLQIFHYGVFGNRKPDKIPDSEVWQNFLKSEKLPLNVTSEEYYQAWEKLIDSPDSFGKLMRREEYPDED